jgi:hypothetical protein
MWFSHTNYTHIHTHAQKHTYILIDAHSNTYLETIPTFVKWSSHIYTRTIIYIYIYIYIYI